MSPIHDAEDLPRDHATQLTYIPYQQIQLQNCHYCPYDLLRRRFSLPRRAPLSHHRLPRAISCSRIRGLASRHDQDSSMRTQNEPSRVAALLCTRVRNEQPRRVALLPRALSHYTLTHVGSAVCLSNVVDVDSGLVLTLASVLKEHPAHYVQRIISQKYSHITAGIWKLRRNRWSCSSRKGWKACTKLNSMDISCPQTAILLTYTTRHW